jgi:WD40 repeat protein
MDVYCLTDLLVFSFQEFLVAEDLNKITLQCTYLGHQQRIHAICFSSHNELLLSVCREKKLNWYSTNPIDENHQHPRGNYLLSSWAISIAIDELSRQCFIGDASGNINFLKINTDNKSQLITTLSGHTGREFFDRENKNIVIQFQEVFKHFYGIQKVNGYFPVVSIHRLLFGILALIKVLH